MSAVLLVQPHGVLEGTEASVDRKRGRGEDRRPRAGVKRLVQRRTHVHEQGLEDLRRTILLAAQRRGVGEPLRRDVEDDL